MSVAVVWRGAGDRLLSCVLVLLAVCGGAAGRRARDGSRPVCTEVHTRCHAREGCKLALNNYFRWCLDLSESEEPYRCSLPCKMALTTLLSSSEHDGPNTFRHCDCEQDDFCRQQKRRMAVCAEDVQTWLDDISDPDRVISCSLAEGVCIADSSCLAAIEYYDAHCKKLFEPYNPRCTSRCNNSLNILYRQTKAQKLRTCQCDGSEEYNCTALKDNTASLCYGATPRPTPGPSTRYTTTVVPDHSVRHPGGHDHTRRPCDGNNLGDDATKDVSASAGHSSAYTGASQRASLVRHSLHVVSTALGLTAVHWLSRTNR